MGQHKSYEKERSWFQLLLCFLGGTVLVAVCLYSMAYFSPGLIGAHGIGKVLGPRLRFYGRSDMGILSEEKAETPRFC